MTLEFEMINLWAVLTCHVLYMLLGALWYSPVLFGNSWLKSMNLKAEDIKKEEANKAILLSNIPTFFSVVVLAVLLGLFKAASIADALILANLFSLGIIGLWKINGALYENQNLPYLLITIGYPTAAFNSMAVILVLWK